MAYGQFWPVVLEGQRVTCTCTLASTQLPYRANTQGGGYQILETSEISE